MTIRKPIDLAESVPSALEVLLEATRRLLWVKSAADATTIVVGVVTALGGTIRPAQNGTSGDL